MHFETIPNEKKARLVFGLDWRAYATKGAAGERRRYADELDATHYVEIKRRRDRCRFLRARDRRTQGPKTLLER